MVTGVVAQDQGWTLILDATRQIEGVQLMAVTPDSLSFDRATKSFTVSLERVSELRKPGQPRDGYGGTLGCVTGLVLGGLVGALSYPEPESGKMVFISREMLSLALALPFGALGLGVGLVTDETGAPSEFIYLEGRTLTYKYGVLKKIIENEQDSG